MCVCVLCLDTPCIHRHIIILDMTIPNALQAKSQSLQSLLVNLQSMSYNPGHHPRLIYILHQK